MRAEVVAGRLRFACSLLLLVAALTSACIASVDALTGYRDSATLYAGIAFIIAVVGWFIGQ